MFLSAEEQLFNGTQSLQSPLVDTLGVTFLLYHIIIIPTYNKRGVGSKLFFFYFFLIRKDKSAVNYVSLEWITAVQLFWVQNAARHRGLQNVIKKASM